jgi:hypothetical protein
MDFLRIVQIFAALFLLVIIYLIFDGIRTFASKNRDVLRAERVKRDGELRTRYAEKSFVIYFYTAIVLVVLIGYIFFITDKDPIIPRGTLLRDLCDWGVVSVTLVCGFIIFKTGLKNMIWYWSEMQKERRDFSGDLLKIFRK